LDAVFVILHDRAPASGTLGAWIVLSTRHPLGGAGLGPPRRRFRTRRAAKRKNCARCPGPGLGRPRARVSSSRQARPELAGHRVTTKRAYALAREASSSRRATSASLPRVSIEIEASWYRGLRSVKWKPEGVAVLVGQNGAGKSTLLNLLLLLSKLQSLSDQEALEQVGGTWGVVHVNAPEGSPAPITIRVDNLRYGAVAFPDGSILQMLMGQTLAVRKNFGSTRAVLNNPDTGEPVEVVETKRKSVVEAWLDKDRELQQECEKLQQTLEEYRVYSRYNLEALRTRGSPQSSDLYLLPDGSNVFSLLRNWRDSGEMEERYEFVSEGLRKAFPGQFRRFDFDNAQTVVFAAFSGKNGPKVPARAVSEGMLTMLLHLCAVASTPDGGMVAIDEPENSLSPYGVRIFLEHTRERAAKRDLTVLLATHSPALLNHFKDEPENVWVMDPEHDVTPKALTELHDEDWIARFSIGDLYAREVVGAPQVNGAAAK
jgi:predicted ATPase